MNRSRTAGTLLAAAVVAVCLAGMLVSCSMSASRRSFTGKLDEIDALIEQGQDADALAELKKIEKKTYDSWSRIGIFRRYAQLGETAAAERVLRNGLKKNPKNTELSAVYAHFLLRNGRYTEAQKTALCLRGTRYGSLYSEAYLDTILNSDDVSSGNLSFSDPKFYPVYFDAYRGTGDAYWLRNCAVISMKSGDYDKALSLLPGTFQDPEDAYFWGLASYDDKKYAQSAALAVKAQELYAAAPERSQRALSPIETATLLSDSYVSLSRTEEAEKVRRSLMERLAADPAAGTGNTGAYKNLLPSVYVDSALYAESNGDDVKSSALLTYVVNTWPDYVPGLISYADFAYRTSKPLAVSVQEQTLRDKGLATLRMEKYDSRPQIPLSDAEYRMDKSLSVQNDPQLYIARLDLKYKTDTTLSPNEKISDIWNELETSTTGTDTYPEKLLIFAVNKLLTYDQSDDAWSLYSKFISSKYHFDAGRDFWEQTVARVREMSLAEAEYAAWFAAYQRYGDTAERLYEYCVYESSGIPADGSGNKRPAAFVSTASCMDLAMVYSSLGAVPQALALYGAAASRAVDTAMKAECMYRMAVIYAARQDKHEALRSAEYALTLDPSHARAKLLRDTLSPQ